MASPELQEYLNLSHRHQSLGTSKTDAGLSGSSLQTWKRTRVPQTRLDWNKIMTLDSDNLLEFHNWDSLEKLIFSIIFCRIEDEVDVDRLTPNVTKLLKAGQLCMEYLHLRRKELTASVTELKKKYTKCQQKENALKKQVKELSQKLEKERKNSKDKRRLIEDVEKTSLEVKEFNQTSKNFTAIEKQEVLDAVVKSHNKCPYCTKAFVTTPFVQLHISQSHSNRLPVYTAVIQSQLLRPTLVQLPAVDAKLVRTQLEKQLEEVRTRLQLAEEALRDEQTAHQEVVTKLEEENAQILKRNKEDIEAVKSEYDERSQVEFASLKEELQVNLQEVSDKLVNHQEEVYEMRKTLQTLVDNNEGDPDLAMLQTQSQQQYTDIYALQLQMQSQMDDLDELRDSLRLQENRTKKKIKLMKQKMKNADRSGTVQQKIFFPAENEPEVEADMDLTQEDVDVAAIRNELSKLLETELQGLGIPKGRETCSDTLHVSSMRTLRERAKELAQHYPSLYEIRQQCLSDIDLMAKRQSGSIYSLRASLNSNRSVRFEDETPTLTPSVTSSLEDYENFDNDY